MKTLLIAAALLAGAQAFAGSGTDHGNGTDHSELVYPGARKNVPVDPQTLPEPQKLENKLSITKALISLSPTARANAMIAFASSQLLDHVILPASSGKVDDLYHTVSKNRGDYSDLASPQNPFAPLMLDYNWSKSKFDADAFAATLNPAFRTQNLVAAVQDMTIDLTMQMNPELASGKCGACTTDDFTRLPGAGISMKISCRVGNSPAFDVPGAQFTITGQTQTIHKTFDILPAQLATVAASWIKQSICADPDQTTWETGISCSLQPLSDTDSQAMNEKLSITNNDETARWSELYYSGSNLTGLKISFLNSDKVTSGLQGAKVTLSADKSEHDGDIQLAGGYIPTFGIFAHTSVDSHSLKIDKDPTITLSYANQKADMAAFVRNVFVQSYSKKSSN